MFGGFTALSIAGRLGCRKGGGEAKTEPREPFGSTSLLS
jgi:hypothetical protein